MNLNFIHITPIFNALTMYPPHLFYKSIDICKWCFSSRTTHNLKETSNSKAECHFFERRLILPATSKQQSLVGRTSCGRNQIRLQYQLSCAGHVTSLRLSIPFWFSPSSHSRLYGSCSKHPLFARVHLISRAGGWLMEKMWGMKNAVYSTNAQVMRQRRTVLRKTRWKNIYKTQPPGKFLNKAFLLVCFHLVG